MEDSTSVDSKEDEVLFPPESDDAVDDMDSVLNYLEECLFLPDPAEIEACVAKHQSEEASSAQKNENTADPAPS